MIEVKLSRGTLQLEPREQTWSWSDLLTFAERMNPKRAFLFVSKVLGRHIPATPALMRAAFTELGEKIPENLPQPVLVIGMAETAVGLASGVHQVLQKNYPNALFLATTRHTIDAPLMARFAEEHSHAPAHLLYGSTDAAIMQQLRSCKTLILVDDEASTGQTFINLAQALRASSLPELTHVITATLADWAPPLHFEGLQHQSYNLLAGSWHWIANPLVAPPEMPNVASTEAGVWPISRHQTWGRIPTHMAQSPLIMHAQPGERILVLGCNEFVWTPFLLAESLSAQGALVKFSACTRSPIMLGHAIERSISFVDSYGLGMINYAYNVKPEDYDRVVLVIETPPESIDRALFDAIPNLEVLSTYVD